MSQVSLSGDLYAEVVYTGEIAVYADQEIVDTPQLQNAGEWALMSGTYDVSTVGNIFQVLQVEIPEGGTSYAAVTGKLYSVEVCQRETITVESAESYLSPDIKALYGLKLLDSIGRKIYDSRSVTWNQVGLFVAEPGGMVLENYPAASGMELATLQFMVDDLPLDQEAYSHEVAISGTTVQASGGNQRTVVLVLGR